MTMRGRRTLREVMQDHQRSEDTLAAIWGKPRRGICNCCMRPVR